MLTINLEFRQIDVEGAFETKGSRNGRDDLTNQTVQIGIGGPFNRQITAADVVNGFVIHHKSAIGMLQSCVGRQDGIVRLHNGR